ncbi:MAG: DUF4350 domain-containing protein [Microbacterium sp.]|jgi:hypothetical protein|nr:DUF4350 domain-containing protein [Microbacterium sp.]
MTRVAAPDSTPLVARRPRGWRGWLVVVIIVAVASGLLLWAGTAFTVSEKGRTDPESHGPDGYRALVEVLRDHGVRVDVVRSHDEATQLLNGGLDTLVLPDPFSLGDETIRTMIDAAPTTVLLSPSSAVLDLAIPGAEIVGYATKKVTAQCDLTAADNAGAIRPGALMTGGDLACFPADEGAALISQTRDGRTVSALDASLLFTNAHVTENGNAALALALLGEHDSLVWYVPSWNDSDAQRTSDATLADLTPGWVTPALVLLALTAAAAAIWRGRRFGPLVAERLPVTVRASETLEGRARLYAHARDTGHAARILRRRSAAELGRLLGMGRAATTDAVIEAAAAAVAGPRDALRTLLTGPEPATDAELVELSDRLAQWEAAIRAAVRTEGKRS